MYINTYLHAISLPLTLVQCINATACTCMYRHITYASISLLKCTFMVIMCVRLYICMNVYLACIKVFNLAVT